MGNDTFETVIEVIAKAVRHLETDNYLKDIEVKSLKEENLRLKKENEDLRVENERYERFSPVKFEKIERFDENNG